MENDILEDISNLSVLWWNDSFGRKGSTTGAEDHAGVYLERFQGRENPPPVLVHVV